MNFEEFIQRLYLFNGLVTVSRLILRMKRKKSLYNVETAFNLPVIMCNM